MERDLEVWICLVIWSVGFCDVDDLIVCLVVDFVEWTLGVCPDLTGAVESVSESGDEAVEVVVGHGLVEEVV